MQVPHRISTGLPPADSRHRSSGLVMQTTESTSLCTPKNIFRQLSAVFIIPLHSCASDMTARKIHTKITVWAASNNANLAGGNLTRAPEQDRIDFLAQVRNAALEPLWLTTTSESGASNAWFDAKGPRSEVLWPADKVIFLNDVYFCARDAVRLLLHDADMACGMDFDRKKLDQVPYKVTCSSLGM